MGSGSLRLVLAAVSDGQLPVGNALCRRRDQRGRLPRRRSLVASTSIAGPRVFPHLCCMTEYPDRTDADDYATSPREPRQSVFLSATLERFGSAYLTKHRVRDLSPKGMRIDQASDLQVGATVIVAIGHLEAIGATIVWVKRASAGVKFAKAVDPDQARGSASVQPKNSNSPRQVRQSGATAGWVSDLNDPYRK
jgi:hypothetical protein